MTGNRRLPLWVANDAVPAVSGLCAAEEVAGDSFERSSAGAGLAVSRSRREDQFAHQCAATYAADNNCYAPGLPHSAQTFLDLNVSSSADPSGGR